MTVTPEAGADMAMAVSPATRLLEQELLVMGCREHADRIVNAPYTHSAVERAALNAIAICLRTIDRLASPAPSDGYATAFYQIADMLGIGARTDSPAVVWERDMLPALKARLPAPSDAGAGAVVGDVDRVWRAMRGFVMPNGRQISQHFNSGYDQVAFCRAILAALPPAAGAGPLGFRAWLAFSIAAAQHNRDALDPKAAEILTNVLARYDAATPPPEPRDPAGVGEDDHG